MAKTARKQSAIRKKEPPEKQYASLDEINKLIVYNYFKFYKSVDDNKKSGGVETKGWDTERSGCADHYRWCQPIQNHFQVQVPFLIVRRYVS